jgi:hypothetical protein
MGNDCVITSQFFVKNDETGMKILEDIWEAKEWPIGMDINSFDYEGRQTRITIDKPEFKPYVKIIEEKLLNRFWYVNNPFIINRNKNVNDNIWEPGDFIVHVTNYPIQDRFNLMDKLNYFSGGLISCFNRSKNVIDVSPLTELNNVKIHILDINKKILINYFFEKMDYKMKYILYTNDDIDNMDVIINSYSEDKLISYLKALNIKYPEVVYAQAVIESGNFTYKKFIKDNNLFGMKKAKSRATLALDSEGNYARFNTWRESVIDYALYQSMFVRKIKSR